MTQLRAYQREAVGSIFAYFARADGNPLVVAPTGSGKSVLLAAFVKEAIEKFPTTRILIVTHRKELIEQDANAILKYWQQAPLGIYSAGLNRKQIRQVTVAGVQSIHGKDLGHFDLCLVDECHLVPHGDDGMYREVLSSLTSVNPKLKVVGFTATPYRLNGGLLTRGKTKIFSSVCYDISVEHLVSSSYLSPLVSPQVQTQIDTSEVKERGGEFVSSQLAAVADQDRLTQAALDEFDVLASDRKSCLFFCVTKAHAENVVRALRMRGHSAECITDDTSSGDRRAIIDRFKRREIRCLASVDVLTTGFDAPCVDCLAVLRPTASTGLYVQICGRGMRLYPGKQDCLVLDFGQNIDRHGPITNIRHNTQARADTSTLKECPRCIAEIAVWKTECPECGHVFEKVLREINHDTRASRSSIMGPINEQPWIEIAEVVYLVHEKKDKPPSMCVEYRRGFRAIAREWVCFEHGGYATEKAKKWWKQRGGVCDSFDTTYPKTTNEAIDRAPFELTKIEAIRVAKDGEYERVNEVRYRPIDLTAEVPF